MYCIASAWGLALLDILISLFLWAGICHVPI